MSPSGRQSDAPARRRIRRGRLAQGLGALLAAALGAAASPAAAQPCDPGDRVVFAGHAFPLDAPLQIQAMTTEDAFPQLPNLGRPVVITSANDGSNRLFVASQLGYVYVFENRLDVASHETFLDVSGLINTNGGDERGLLGLAFDPEFGDPGSPYYGELYVDYTTDAGCACTSQPGGCAAGCTKVVRYTASESAPGVPHLDTVLSGTAEEILEIGQPFSNHNGGMLAFGPDAMLYISTGDGGSGNDPLNSGQDTSTLLGNILRIDVRSTPLSGASYVIPPDNPFAGATPGADEIWHYGLRNPFRFSFDRANGDLWIGDVGQVRWEEIDHAPAGSSGLNFGWKPCEGAHERGSTTLACSFPSTLPVLAYNRSDGNVVTGGYVYRGDRLPQLRGAYVYADFGSGRIWAWDRSTLDGVTGLGAPQELTSTVPSIASFGEDEQGELYLAIFSSGGRIHRLVPTIGGNSSTFPQLLSQTGLFSDVTTLEPAPGLIEFEVESALWSDHAAKKRWIALPGPEQIDFHAREAWDFPVGTALVKHFDLPLSGNLLWRLETRVLLRQLSGWLGFTFRWNGAQTDATLVPDGASDPFDVDTGAGIVSIEWQYPSSGDCLGCHTAPVGRVLGVRTRQLNRPGPASANQLEAFECLGLFTTGIGDPQQLDAYAALDDLTASRQRRARSYLASNCSHCHLPGGPAPSELDFRFDVLLGEMKAFGVAPQQGDLGLNAPQIIKPGVPAESVLWHRMQSSDASIRMPDRTLLPHAEAVSLFDQWILQDVLLLDSDEDDAPDGADNCVDVWNQDQADTDIDGVGDVCDPDLLPNLSATPQNPSFVVQGAIPTLSATVTNDGGGAAPSSQLRFYLSTDTSFETALDVLVGDCQVPAIGSAAGDGCDDPAAEIPAALFPTTPGATLPYYWVACADALDSVLEADEADNCGVDLDPVLIPEPTPGWLAVAGLASLWLLAAWRGRAEAMAQRRASPLRAWSQPPSARQPQP